MKRIRIARFRQIVLLMTVSIFIVYVSSYFVLSRRGFTEGDEYNAVGFYFFTPEPTDEWRFRNFTLVRIYRPLIIVDNWIGTGRPAACEPLFDLE